jgi:E3 ubiquitin-protein ligase synoviolin
VEQLYEKAWFAITETALAMTVFREEFGGWFLVMFVALLAGKVWGWIGDGRVEILEQQPPANPKLFHARLSASLGLSLLFDLSMLSFTVGTVLRQARPNMMVMFAFEFAILTIGSTATLARYAISVAETVIVKKQTQIRLEERRAEVRAEREEARRNAADPTIATSTADIDIVEVDEMDIEVPGWDEKGRYVFYLEMVNGEFYS